MKPHLRRNMLILALGIGFLVLTALFGTFISNYEDAPHEASAQIQKQQAGPYEITLQVNPNPPSINTPATIIIQVVRSGTQQLLTNAHVSISGEMPEMNMSPNQAEAKLQKNGTYTTNFQFSMSGSWLLQVRIEAPDHQLRTQASR
ncbi:FixH family protein [Ktedonospora formicarum]|uniref:YtkA-like domain-containing protein n=1 Tax=Ktedonospora formicarum TaxID=2778364 RepID=A0A8J3I0Q3_9CHLR|nr:FixH family protein [Ktedonospora formicarum]GHO43953.1 hypothetical protein KSX_21160 [Ktedonospora formicarum]